MITNDFISIPDIDSTEPICPMPYVYEVIKGDYKGKKVYSFHDVFDQMTGAPMACFDDEYDYVIFGSNLRYIGIVGDAEMEDKE